MHCACHTTEEHESTSFHFLIFSESLMSLESSEQHQTLAHIRLRDTRISPGALRTGSTVAVRVVGHSFTSCCFFMALFCCVC